VSEYKDILEIEQAHIGDLQEITRIYQAAIQDMVAKNILQWDELYPEENILRADIVSGQMSVGRINGEIISCFSLNQIADPEYLTARWQYTGDDYVVLHRLCVKTAWQHRGLGARTMAAIERYVRELGAKSLRLDAFAQNPLALKMYQNLGYTQVGAATWRKGRFYIYEKVLS
jgi:GNAT superfamily N-acetyltransferase